MDWGSVLFMLALALLSGLFVAWPLLEPEKYALTTAGDRRVSVLLAEREEVLDAIAELDFDYEMGKMDEAAYQARRAELLRRGAEILRELDALRGKAAKSDNLEELIRKRRAERAVRRPVVADDEIEALLAERKRQREAEAGGFCPHCGAPVLKTDRYCPRCGARLRE